MRRLILFLAAMTSAAPVIVTAQSSQYGVRGIGLTGRQLSVRSLGVGGAMSLFDGGSSVNPAGLALLQTTSMEVSTTQSWRNSENLGGSASARDQRFPHLMVGGPLPSLPLAVGLSFSTYADRDFTLVTEGVDSPRGVPINVTDTLGSTGGINDLRLGVAWTPTSRIRVGVGLHFLTGSNRMFSRRAWEDTSYQSERQEAELTYSGMGLSAGVIMQLSPRFLLGASARQDGKLSIERDSTAEYNLELPWTLTAGARFLVSPRLAVAGQVVSRDWSVADPELVAQGGVGARNTIEYSGGLQLVRNTRRPDHLPLRIGVRHAKLPFLLTEGQQPQELGISVGTGIRFAGDLGGIDLALERIQRDQAGSFKETAWQLSIGVSVRAPTPR
jgi:hypothetical protein